MLAAIPNSQSKIPLWLKVLYTGYLAILVPIYWHDYTPVNFLWFCDVALLVTLIALWLESSFLASMQAVAITLPQLLWVLDFIVRATAGVHIIDLTEYMFDPSKPLFLRALSTFHGWLPFLLLWMLWRLGYDRRAWIAQTFLAWAVLWSAYIFVQDPTNSNTGPGNVNKIGGPADNELQR
ncbi:MAG: hypothetical protein ACJ8FY_28495 [Gemmataceae bacterium]